MKKLTLAFFTLFIVVAVVLVSYYNHNWVTEENVVITTPTISNNPNILFISIDNIGLNVSENYPNITDKKTNIANTTKKRLFKASIDNPLIITSKTTYVYTEKFGQSEPRTNGYTIRNKDYKLIHTEDGIEYLFKLTSDPFEQNNLLSATLTTEAQQNITQLKTLKRAYGFLTFGFCFLAFFLLVFCFLAFCFCFLAFDESKVLKSY